jgi:tRNA A-37 threonylcarbamoyl transferase component Bud32
MMDTKFQFQALKLGLLNGLMRLDDCIPEMLEALSDPDSLLNASDLLFKNSARTKAGCVMIKERPFFLKRYNQRGMIHTAKTIFRPSRPWRVRKLAVHLIQNGVNTPAPVAILEERRFGLLMRSYLVTEYVPGERIRAFMSRRVKDSGWQAGTVAGVAGLIAKLHASGVCHRDLKANNILLETDKGKERLWLIDLDGARLKSDISDKDRIADLGRLLTSFSDILPPFEIYRFLIHYSKESGVWQDNKKRRDVAKRLRTILSEHQARHGKKRSARVEVI